MSRLTCSFFYLLLFYYSYIYSIYYSYIYSIYYSYIYSIFPDFITFLRHHIAQIENQ